MSDTSVAVARQLIETPELLLADPSNAETLDLIIACTLKAFEPGHRYLRALNERGIAARSGSTLDLMRWSLAVTRTRAVLHES